jgi:intracellular sulfur oxidation DsrE/DsrF family protein
MFIVYPLANSFSEEKKPLSLEDVGNLLRSNISKKRVVITIEENGIKFLKTKNNLEHLKKSGADEIVLGAIEKEWKKDERILIIETVPAGSTIYLDQEKVGETPIEIEGLKPRKYAVKITKEGYESVDHEISLTEGIGRKLTISLVRSSSEMPSPALSTPSPLTPAPVPEPASPPAPTPTIAPAATPPLTGGPPQMCSVFVNTQPGGAKIYIDGKHYGTSPKYVELLPGEHSIVMVKEFYRPAEKKIICRGEEKDLPPIDQRLDPVR